MHGAAGRSLRRGAAAQKDGYEAAQLGLVEFVKPQRVNKAMTGHFKKANVAPVKVLQEVRIGESKDETKVGDRVLVENFKAGELVDVSGVSKGRGFAGGVKRWHYAGGDATHGSMFHRAPGGIGLAPLRPVVCQLLAVRFPRAYGRTSIFRGTWGMPR